MKKNTTLRLIIPEWHGGVNPNYVFGSHLLAQIAPPGDADETVEISVDTEFHTAPAAVDGIDGGDLLLRQMQETARILADRKPEKVIVFGGDCSVSQVPFDYLSGIYGAELGILWLDAHPDVAGPADSSHLHEMVLANLLGQNGASPITRTAHPVPPAKVALAGLIEERLSPMDGVCKALNITIFSPEELQKGRDRLCAWIRAQNIKKLAVHWDLDVLSPEDFRSIYPAEPHTKASEFRAAVGRLTLRDVGRIFSDISADAEIVGLSITEHLPWDAFNLRKALSSIPLFHTEA